MRTKPVSHDAATERINVDELLSRFPITGRDGTWNARPVMSKAFHAAHRVFDKHFKDKLKVDETD